MKNVQKIKVKDIEDVQRMFENIWQLLEQLPIYMGYGTPENEVVASRGAIYMRKDGGTNTTIYFKETGDKSSGWRAI